MAHELSSYAWLAAALKLCASKFSKKILGIWAQVKAEGAERSPWRELSGAPAAR